MKNKTIPISSDLLRLKQLEDALKTKAELEKIKAEIAIKKNNKQN